jgi:hypothetical protein
MEAVALMAHKTQLLSSWRRFGKNIRWRGEVSRKGLAAALRRWRQERDRIYQVRAASVPRRIDLGW